MKLSVSMIVKNEGSCLAKCLETVKDAIFCVSATIRG